MATDFPRAASERLTYRWKATSIRTSQSAADLGIYIQRAPDVFQRNSSNVDTLRRDESLHLPFTRQLSLRQVKSTNRKAKMQFFNEFLAVLTTTVAVTQAPPSPAIDMSDGENLVEDPARLVVHFSLL